MDEVKRTILIMLLSVIIFNGQIIKSKMARVKNNRFKVLLFIEWFEYYK
jgi:hypothetical protein